MNFFLKHKYLVLLLVSVVSVVSILLVTRKQKQTPTITTKTKIDTISIGKSTKEEVIKILGSPIAEKTAGNFDVLTFGSSSPTRPDQVFIKQNIVQMTKEIISFQDQRKAEAIKNNNGVASNILYGSDALAGFYLFVYPDKGLAYLGNPNSDDLLEIWHFASTDIQSFKRDLAPDYKDSLPSPIQ